MNEEEKSPPKIPKANKKNKAIRGGLSVPGAIPFIGGIFSAAADAWSEKEQEHINQILEQWLQHFEQELREKGQTILEIMARLDMQEEKVRDRVGSQEFQLLVKKAFQNWSRIDTDYKRIKVRNLLSNAAATDVVSDDVVRLFLDWIDIYSDFHFQVMGVIANNAPIGRGEIWNALGRPHVREDSADADLYRLLIRDLSMGGVIRQERATDAYGNFVRKSTKGQKRSAGSSTMKSAFDDDERYVLTDLGRQFIHYAMTEIPPKIEFTDFNTEHAA